MYRTSFITWRIVAIQQYGASSFNGCSEISPAGIVKYLLAHGADVNVEDELGNVSLYYAVQKNDVEMVKELFSSPVLDITHSSIEYDDDTDQEIIKLIKQKKKKIKSK